MAQSYKEILPVYIYHNSILNFKNIIQSHEALEDYFTYFKWNQYYPHIKETEIINFNGYIICSNLEIFSKYCNQYTSFISRQDIEIMVHYLTAYRDAQLLQRDPIQLFWNIFSYLDEYEKMSIEIIFQRTFFPLNSLITVDKSCLFISDDEYNIEVANKMKNTKAHPEEDLKPELQTLYSGYGCFIIKVTRLCNLRCVYCQDWRSGKGNTLVLKDFSSIIQNIFKSKKLKNIEFVWHGGEPTLIGVKNFYKYLYLISLLKLPEQIIVNTIQTNGIDLKDEWIEVFRTFEIKVGVSIDGPDFIHDKNRPKVNGKASFNNVYFAIQKLRHHKLPVNIIMVGTEDIIEVGAEKILEFLISINVDNCAILPLLPGNCKKSDEFDYAHHRRLYFDFLYSLYVCKKQNSIKIGIREIDILCDVIKDENPRHCELLGSCVGVYFSIEPDGSVYHCDKYVNDIHFKLGNLITDTIDVISTNHQIRLLAQSNQEIVAKYSSCRFIGKCSGWCPHEFYLKNLYNIENEDCCGLKGIFEKIESDILTTT